MLTERGAPPAGGGRIRHCRVVIFTTRVLEALLRCPGPHQWTDCSGRSWFPPGHQSSVGGLQASMKHEINVLTSVYTLTVLPDVGSL